MELERKKMKNPLQGVINFFKFIVFLFIKGDALTRLSFFFMGASNLFRGQVIKGGIYLFTELSYLFYMINTGFMSFTGLRYLGTKTQGMVMDESLGIFILQEGDNSMILLLEGVIAIFVTFFFLVMWISNIRSAYEAQEKKQRGKKLPTFKEDIHTYFDAKLYKTLMILPLMGIVVFTILPLVFMILIAFTNFDNAHQPPGNLFTWVGLSNFKKILLSGEVISRTFWPILGWTLVWAFFATTLNYIGGVLLALLINRKDTKYKSFWRTMFVISIAVPQFVTLLVIRTMLNNEGAVNVLLQELKIIPEKAFLPFISDPTWARVTVIVVNLWIGIPYSMLITTGILMNIPSDLYESARVDGAGPVRTFFKITLPYVIFVTTPYLITNFIGNINNFNVIYFLTAGGPLSLSYYQAGKTDLLVTWLYKLTTGSLKDYSYASTIGILVFGLSAIVSLITYRNTGAYKREEEFQ